VFDEGTGPVATEELLIPGETCWRIERADRQTTSPSSGKRC
jgi:phospholipase D1/2